MKENRENVNYEVKKLIEFAYRKGYSHGYSVGTLNEYDNDISKKIKQWKNDLFIMKGAPASNYENTEIKWCDTDCEGYKNDVILAKYWNDKEEKAFERIKESRKGQEGFDSEGNRI